MDIFIFRKVKRMAQKYIVGDVVMYDNKIMVIKEPRDGSHFDLSCPKEGLVYCLVDIDEINPIPLTPEILEKNGWKLSHGFYWSPNEEGAGVGLSSQTGYVWKAYIERHLLRSNINNVSDLQHLLFGLGLNSEMEV